MNLEKKLNEIIKRLNKIEEKISNIDSEINAVSERLNLLEVKFENKSKEVDTILDTKADIDLVKQLSQKIILFEEFQSNCEKALLMKESYDKRLNILIHGIQEDNNNVWEKRVKTIEKFQDFLKNGLKINPNEIKLSDILQQPITKNGRPVHQLIIVKLLTIHDKNLIFKSAKNLGQYNAMCKESGSTNLNTYITDHLPAKFQEQQKLLLSYYKEAKKNKKKTMWKALDGNYTLFIDNKQVDLLS